MQPPANKSNEKPRVALFAAFYAGFEVTQFALEQPFSLAFVATCDRDDSEYESRIAGLCEEKGVSCLRRVNVNSTSTIEEIVRQGLDIAILAWWPSIIKCEALSVVRKGWLNLHPSLLPFNRGKHPYYWSIVEGTPFGVSIHLVDKGIDTGHCLFQQAISIDITDTGESLYRKSVETNIALFKESYEQIVSLDFVEKEQDSRLATFHWGREIEPHSTINLDKSYRALDLLNIIRARTFQGGPSACFYKDGKKYFVRIQIEESQDGVTIGKRI